MATAMRTAAKRPSPPTKAPRRPPLPNPRRRARSLFVICVFALSLFAAQLLRIQAFDASQTQELALAKRLVTVTQPAMRGRILDARGQVLAASFERRTITVDQTAVPEYVVDTVKVGVPQAAVRLAPLLAMDVAEVERKITGDERYVILAKDVTPTVWREINAIGIPGIYSETTAKRSYPAGASTASLVGFVNSTGTGAAGLELLANQALSGEVGSVSYERARNGLAIPGAQQASTPAVDGADVVTTLDADLQWVAENAIARTGARSRAASASVVVLDVSTGKIRAVASYPTFDPTDPGKVSSSVRENRAFQDAYEPGSTGKVMTIAAAIEEQVVTAKTPVIVPNRLPRADRLFRDSHDHATLALTTAGVLAQSSNIGTMLIGERMRPKTIESYFTKFGIGQPTGVGFPGETAGSLTPAAQVSGSQRYTMLFGQGYSVNAIQAASVYQTIGNKGERIAPTLIEATVAPDGSRVPAPAPERTQVVSPKTAKIVTDMMEEVVGPNGTAPGAAVPGYRVAGKTGTANRYNAALGRYSGYTASFIGFAPADAPKYVVAVTVQDPKGVYFGGVLGAPVFKEVMGYALTHANTPPTGTKAPKVAVKAKGSVRDGQAGVLGPSGQSGTAR